MNTSLFQGDLVSSNRIIYTPSPFAKANLLHLQEVGELHAQKPHTSTRNNLSSYLFFIVEKGSGSLNYDGITYQLSDHDCVVIDCLRPYAHCSSNNLWSLRWAHFYGCNLKNIYEKYLQYGGQPCFSTFSQNEYSALLKALFATANADNCTKDVIIDMKINEILSTLLTHLLGECLHFDSSQTPIGNKRNLMEIKNYLNENYTKRITLDELSEKFFLNKFYLTRLFREHYGITINAYMLQLRITHAKHQLRFSDLSIEQIANACGFDDANYFSRTFKRIEDCTPGQYRKRW